MPAKEHVLIVDDDTGVRASLCEFLEGHGFAVQQADSVRGADEQFRRERPAIVIVDYRMPDGTALDLMSRVRAVDAAVPFVVLTGYGSIDLAVRAMKEGAENFLTKPIELATLLVIVQRCVQDYHNRRARDYGERVRARSLADPFI